MDQPKHILLVEDDLFIREIYLEVLSSPGRVITCAANGAEGLDKLRTQYYDLVITDVVMPHKDGLAMLSAMRKENIKQGKIIIYSNLDYASTKEEVEPLQVDGYFLSANYTPKEFADVIASYLQ